MIYEPRESINPRAFALRHALLEELKLRQLRAADDTRCAEFAALARALEVSYDSARRSFSVHGVGSTSCDVALDALQLYEPREDAADVVWQRVDARLAANRALAAQLIDQLLALAARGNAR